MDETYRSRKHICVCVLLMKAAEKNEAGLAGWLLAGYATQKAEVLGVPDTWPGYTSPGSHWEDTTTLPPYHRTTAKLYFTTNTTILITTVQ